MVLADSCAGVLSGHAKAPNVLIRCSANISNLHLRHYMSTTLMCLERTHRCQRCDPSPPSVHRMQQNERTLPARFGGGTQKVAGPGETRPMKKRAHLCGAQGGG